MKIYLAVFIFILCMLINSKSIYAKNVSNTLKEKLCFIENKGQIRDQNGNVRYDINYVIQTPGLSVFIGKGFISYQFYQQELSPFVSLMNTNNAPEINKCLFNDSICTALFGNTCANMYRMDVSIDGINNNVEVISEEKQNYYENYYLAGLSENGIRANTCNKVVYKNIYNGIDWVLYIKGNKLEHEFIIGEHADVSEIKLVYNGQTALKLNEDGSITATTPMGVIKEKAPVCYSKSKELSAASYQLDGNILSYKINNLEGSYVIDPVLEWGTYYGPDSNCTKVYGSASDYRSAIYIAGLTYSSAIGSIATTGSFETTYGGGDTDGFLTKFDTSGNRLWATYYGGPGGDWATGVSCDHSGNVYIDGTTNSTSGIASIGAQQTTYGGGMWDGFLVRFDAAGNRKWATYCGGMGANITGSSACDTLGHVYLAGEAADPNNIATTTGFYSTPQGSYDCFLVQYDSLGVRQWGTYYGGPDADFGGVTCTDGANVYLTGYSASTTGIATPHSYQQVNAGSNDVFLVKFNSAGNRIWGSYFGGPGQELSGGITCGRFGYVYLLGSTASTSGIASAGAFQHTYGGGTCDAFLAMFQHDTGYCAWSTYYGGPGEEKTDYSRIICDRNSNIYIIGYTNSTSGISTIDSAYQPTYGGGTNDVFFAKYANNGIQFWSSYYGGSGEDIGQVCAYDGENIYISGQTNSSDSIATPGSFLSSWSGGTYYFSGFLIKFHYLDTAGTLKTESAISNTTLENIKLFPNPNSGNFTILAEANAENSKINIEIIDILSRVIYKDEGIVSNHTFIKSISLPKDIVSGEYVIKFTYNKEIKYIKFNKN